MKTTVYTCDHCGKSGNKEDMPLVHVVVTVLIDKPPSAIVSRTEEWCSECVKPSIQCKEYPYRHVAVALMEPAKSHIPSEVVGSYSEQAQKTMVEGFIQESVKTRKAVILTAEMAARLPLLAVLVYKMGGRPSNGPERWVGHLSNPIKVTLPWGTEDFVNVPEAMREWEIVVKREGQ